MQNWLLYNFPHNMVSENLILTFWKQKTNKKNRAVGPDDFKRHQRGSIINYKAEFSLHVKLHALQRPP